jgi:hypothetical protein
MRLSRVIAAAVLGAALAGCSQHAAVSRPCGVIIDSLGTVKATTKDGQRRLAAHFERGVRAGCWPREAAAVLKAALDGTPR